MQATGRATGRDGHPPLPRAVVHWLLLVPVLLAVFALHVLTAEDAVVGVASPTTPTAASVGPAGPVDAGGGAVVESAAAAVDAVAADAPGVLQDPWGAGCLLFLAALWVIAVLRRRVPVRAPLQASWWPGAVAGPPLWPVARLSLGVTRI